MWTLIPVVIGAGIILMYQPADPAIGSDINTIARGMIVGHDSIVSRAILDRPTDTDGLHAHPALDATTYWSSAMGSGPEGRVILTWTPKINDNAAFSRALGWHLEHHGGLLPDMFVAEVTRLDASTIRLAGGDYSGLPSSLENGQLVVGHHLP